MKLFNLHFSVERLVAFITLFFVFAGLGLPRQMVDPHIVFFGFSLILAGVPHGASDFYLSRQLSEKDGKDYSPIWLLIGYISIMLLYSVLWWVFPQVAFWTFIGISAYHFGQSNWSFMKFPNSFIKKLTFLFWGSAIVGVPVILHFDQASIIVSEMTGVQFALVNSDRAALIFMLFFGVVGTMLYLYNSGALSAGVLKVELGKFFLLMLLFFTTPLLVGFGVYFVLWHSLASVSDQIKVIKVSEPAFGYKKYFRTTMPLTIVAYIGLGLLYFFFNGYVDRGQSLGLLFIFISVITVPHAVLMDRLYHVGGSELEKVSGE